MLKLPQKVQVRWNSKNKYHFIEKGYKFTKIKDYFYADINDLNIGSNSNITYICDYCKNEYEIQYKVYIRKLEKSAIKKDCCNSCQSIKTKESNLLKYGVENPNQRVEVREKTKHTNLERYGFEYPSQSLEVKNRTIQTNINKYGTKYVLQSKEIRDKIKSTNLNKYGGNTPMSDDNVKEKLKNTMNQKYGGLGNGSPILSKKIQNTMLKKYGVKSPVQLEEVREKANKMLNNSKKHKSSKQQEYILKVCGGKLNYPVGRYSLDIAFPKDKIYIEFDGSGHDLPVRMGNMTKERFLEKEKTRSNVLYQKGWKELRIVSLNDKLPLENKLKEIINKNIDKLKETKALKKIKIDFNKLENINLYRVKGEKM